VGTLELRVPRVRDGRFFRGLLEPRKRAERALVATVREANVQGVSTRRLDDLVKALGLDGIRRARSAGCAKSWIPRGSQERPPCPTQAQSRRRSAGGDDAHVPHKIRPVFVAEWRALERTRL
jgi:hypothetical protein